MADRPPRVPARTARNDDGHSARDPPDFRDAGGRRPPRSSPWSGTASRSSPTNASSRRAIWRSRCRRFPARQSSRPERFDRKGTCPAADDRVSAAFRSCRSLRPRSSRRVPCGPQPRAGCRRPWDALLRLQQLTDDAGVETDPAISPDGASVASCQAPKSSRTSTCSGLAAAIRLRSPPIPHGTKTRRRFRRRRLRSRFTSLGGKAVSSSPAPRRVRAPR